MGLTQTLTSNVEEIAQETATMLKTLDIPLINENEYSVLMHQMGELVNQLVLAMVSFINVKK